ncbi:MAG: hypothetical protein CM1200mP2_41230 [Planctomycetaceae bacterium]|nr:MAG: hypothetical protein CM1200mP2_41230 [Planctomycetaceae bacterium]
MKVFRDGDLYRMYYRGSDVIYTKDGFSTPRPEVACYAESPDGIHWTRPDLGLFEFNGSKKNNIIWMGYGAHNFAPFLDENPDCPADERIKALAGSSRRGLWAFASADGKKFRKLRDKAVIDNGFFDSLNLAFWDSVSGLYREFHRDFRGKGVTSVQEHRRIFSTGPEPLSGLRGSRLWDATRGCRADQGCRSGQANAPGASVNSTQTR